MKEEVGNVSVSEINELYGRKQNLVYQMRDITTKVRERTKPGEVPVFSDEEDQAFTKADADLKSIQKTIEKLERQRDLYAQEQARRLQSQEGNGSEEDERIAATYAKQRSVWNKAERKGVDALNKTERKIYDQMADQSYAFEKFLRFGAESLDQSEMEEVRALKTTIVEEGNKRAQTVTTTGGGYTIPQGFNPDIVVSLKSVSPFFEEMQLGASGEARKVFNFIETASGNPIPWPTVDDTSNTGELLAINSDAFANTTDLVFGQKTLLAYKYSPKPMKVPNELLQDTGINLPELIGDMLGTRLGRIVNTQLTTGDNSSKPQGIVSGATSGKVTASATAITFNEVIDLIHSVDPSYRKSPSARLMFHDNVLAYFKKLAVASGDARSLWKAGHAVGAPDTIDGYQYLINQDMASSVATGNKTVLFGDMKKYAVRQAGPFVLRLLTERFADYDQVAWVLFARFDGRILDSSAIKYLEQT